MPGEVKIVVYESDPSGWFGGFHVERAPIQKLKELKAKIFLLSELPTGRLMYLDVISAEEASELLKAAEEAGVEAVRSAVPPTCLAWETCIGLVPRGDGRYWYVAW